jgi:type IV pilus assembly protein PilM
MVKIFETLFGGSNERSAIGLDISSSSIKLVQLKKAGGRAVLETYGELALGPYTGIERGHSTNLPSEKIAEALKNILKESKVTTTNCGAALPLSSSLISILNFPRVSEKELAEMVPLEIRKYLPVSISEVALDWWVIPEDENFGEDEGGPKKDVKTEVLTVSVHKDVIVKYQQILSMAGLNTSFFEVEVFSTIRSTLEPSLLPNMILDLGSATTKIYIIEKGVIRDSHVINRGSQDITAAIASGLGVPTDKAEDLKRGESSLNIDPQRVLEIQTLVLNDIFSEANRVILNYQKKRNKSVSKVILAGGGSIIPNVIDVAKSSFETDVFTADPFSKVETPAFLGSVLKKAGPEFAVALGAALRKLEEMQ